MPVARIEIKGLTVSYGDNVAVDNIDLQVDDGELLVLLGPSGCGKTTTMRSIAGLEKPVAGSITIGDRAVFDSDQKINQPPSQRDVGMVFQSYAIWPHKTVMDNVAFPLRVKRVPRSAVREQAIEALKLVGLEDMADRGASRLSGGQMQRVALARSLVMKPQALLLDEPLSNLDAKLREKLRFEIKGLLQSLGITAVYVTHDQDEALALADRIAVMRDGRFQQIGPPVDLYRSPASAFVANFLGSSNQFAATSAKRAGEYIEIVLNGHVKLRAREVLADGKAIADSDLDAHQVVCTIRPEAARILGDGETPGVQDDTLNGTIEIVSFMGSVTRYQVNIGDKALLEIVQQERHVAPLVVGQKVKIAVDPADVLAYAGAS